MKHTHKHSVQSGVLKKNRYTVFTSFYPLYWQSLRALSTGIRLSDLPCEVCEGNPFKVTICSDKQPKYEPLRGVLFNYWILYISVGNMYFKTSRSAITPFGPLYGYVDSPPMGIVILNLGPRSTDEDLEKKLS